MVRAAVPMSRKSMPLKNVVVLLTVIRSVPPLKTLPENSRELPEKVRLALAVKTCPAKTCLKAELLAIWPLKMNRFPEIV